MLVSRTRSAQPWRSGWIRFRIRRCRRCRSWSGRRGCGPARPRWSTAARRLTYCELAAGAQRVARALRASGVGPGDRVAYLMPNLPEMLIAHYAVPLAGGVLVAVNTRLTAEEVAYIFSHSGAKLVVVDAALLPAAVAAAKDVAAVTELVVAEDTEIGAGGSGSERRSAAGELLRVPGPGHGGAAVLVGLRRACPYRDQLHLRDHGAPEGRGLHPPRRVPELFRRDHSLPARREQRLSVDVADVPLQRLVHPVVADRHRRHARVPARGPRRRDLAAAARARRHPPQRGPDRGEHHPERARGRPADPAGPDHHGRRTAQPHDDRAHGTHGLPDRARLRADRDLRPDLRTASPSRSGPGCHPRSAPCCRPARA